MPAGAMLGYGSHSPRFSGEAAKAAKAASAQGSLGFSGDSGRRVLRQIKIGSVLSAPGYARVPTGPKKEQKKEMGHPRSQHFVLESRDIESVTRRVGRWGFSKVYPWNGRIQP